MALIELQIPAGLVTVEACVETFFDADLGGVDGPAISEWRLVDFQPEDEIPAETHTFDLSVLDEPICEALERIDLNDYL